MCSEQFGWLQCSEIAHFFAELQRLRDAVVAILTRKPQRQLQQKQREQEQRRQMQQQQQKQQHVVRKALAEPAAALRCIK